MENMRALLDFQLKQAKLSQKTIYKK